MTKDDSFCFFDYPERGLNQHKRHIYRSQYQVVFFDDRLIILEEQKRSETGIKYLLKTDST